jgi:hypothetical protein
MTSEQIHASLDKMLANPKTKNFINHLVRSYIPVSNIEKVLETPKGDFKCVITKEVLVSVQSIFEGMDTEEFKKDFTEHLKSMFSEEKLETPMSKLLGDKKLGFTGKDTTTYMSYTATQEFYNWVITKSLKGDKHINWLLGSVNRNTFIKRASNIEDQDVQKKVTNLKKVSGVSTYSLGDATDVLSKLKAKLDNK